MAAIHFFIDSIKNKCQYHAYPCNSQSDFDKGYCVKCSIFGCNRMGLWANNNNKDINLYLNTKPTTTNNKENLCIQNFGVTLHSHELNNQNIAKGEFKIQFESESGQMSATYLLDDGLKTFYAGSVESALISLSDHFNHDIERIHVSYTRYNNFLWLWSTYDDKWAFDYIFLTDAQNQITYKYCSTTTYINSGKSAPFILCYYKDNLGDQ